MNHKTTIVLNGGNQAALTELYQFLNDPDNSYPFDYFVEDEQSLNGALTCVGICLPGKIYEGASLLRDSNTEIALSPPIPDQDKLLYTLTNPIKDPDQLSVFKYTAWEIDLMTRLNTYRLA